MSTSNTPILITTCTKSKSAGSLAYIPAEHALFQSQDDLLHFWAHALASIPDDKKIRARQLYTGRSFKRALLTIGEAIEDLYIISAGLGLVKADENVVPYDLTTSTAAPNRVSKQIAFGGFDPTEWWSSLNASVHGDGHPIATIIRANPDRTIVLCLSKEYLKMVLADISSMTPNEFQHVRIIGSDLDELLPIYMFDIFMPYDLRMNASEEAVPGSRIDFSIRAAVHFVTNILPKTQDLEEQKALVKTMLDTAAPLSDADDDGGNRKATDEEIVEFIKGDFPKYQGRKVMHLRLLREQHRVRCSLNRFDKLYAVAMSQLKPVPQIATAI